MARKNSDYYVYAYLRSRDSDRGSKYSPYYIGKGRGDRAFVTKRSINCPRDKSLIVFIQEGITESQAFALEKYAIATYGRLDKNSGILWNMTDGGEGCSGVIVSDETRAKIAKVRIGKKHHPDTCAKISKSKMGQRHSEKTRRQMSESRRGKKKGPHTDEAKRRISEHKAKYEYEIFDPEGNLYSTQNLNAFCKEKGLHQAHMSAVAHGKMKSYKKWTVRIVQELPPFSQY